MSQNLQNNVGSGDPGSGLNIRSGENLPSTNVPEGQKRGKIGRFLHPGHLVKTVFLPLLDPIQTNRQFQAQTSRIEADSDVLKKRHGRLQVQENLADRIRPFDPRLAARVKHCGYRVKRDVTICEHHEKGKFYQSRFCGFRGCPTDAARRAYKLRRHFVPALKKYNAEHRKHEYFMTLTAMNTRRLPDTKEISKALRTFWHDLVWKPYGLHGYFRILESKIGSGSGEWHVHHHVYLLTDKPLPTISDPRYHGRVQINVNQAFSDAWSKATAGNGRIVDVRSFDGRYEELIKYMCKSLGEMNDDQLEEWIVWQKGLRSYAFGGHLRNNPQLRASIKESEQLEKLELVDKVKCSVCGETRTFEEHHRFNAKLKHFEFDYVKTVIPAPRK